MDERRWDEEGERGRGTERPNRKGRDGRSPGKRGKEKSWRHSRHTVHSLRSLRHGLRDDLFSLVPSRARSRPAFRSHTDTAGLIRVRLTYCLIIGPPIERSRAPIRRATPATFPAASESDRDWRESRARTAHRGRNGGVRRLIDHIADKQMKWNGV